MNRWIRSKRVRFISTLMVILIMISCIGYNSSVDAMTKLKNVSIHNKSHVQLSEKDISLFEGDKKTIKLSGFSAKVRSGKIKWKTSNKRIVTISKKYGRKITVKAKKAGKVKITATYKKKKYSCVIIVRKDEPLLNSTEVSIHRISDYAVPVIGKNPLYNYSFQFEVTGTRAKVLRWSLEGDKKIISRFVLTDEGKIFMLFGNAYNEDLIECTVVAHLSDGRQLRASVKGYDDDTIYVKKKIEEFKKKYITDKMTEYEKMEKVAWYLSTEYDYELYQPDWTKYIITGSGDCMASRIAVMYFCRELGLHASYCPDLDAHGDTVVRADGKVYLVTTGFNEKKPRTYWINEMSRELFDKRNAKNHIDPNYIWGE